MNLKKQYILFSLALGLSLSDGQAGEVSFQRIFGGRALALNGLYIAGTDGLQSMFSNPATLYRHSGTGINVSVVDRIGESRFSSPERGRFVSFRNDDFSVGAGVYFALSNRLNLALAYQRLADYNVEWPYAMLFEDQETSVVLTFDLFNRYTMSSYGLGASYNLGALSLGLTAEAIQTSHNMAFPVSTPDWQVADPLRAGYQHNYEQESWTFGLNTGLLYTLNPDVSLGLVFRIPLSQKLEGTASGDLIADMARADTNYTGAIPPTTTDLTSEIELPVFAGAGLLYRISQQIVVNLDVAYSLWSGVAAEINYQFDDPVWTDGLQGVDNLTGIDPSKTAYPNENALDLGVGLEYSADPGLILRLGYRYGQSPSTPQSYSQLFPMVPQHWISGGIGFDEEKFSADLGIAWGVGTKPTVSKNENRWWYGEYNGQSVIPVLSMGYRL